MSTPGSPGLRGNPNRAPHWSGRVFPNWPINPTESTKRDAPAYIRIFTSRHVNIHFTLRTTTIHFLHTEHSSTQRSHRFHIHFSRVISRTQHRLSAPCHFWRLPPERAGITHSNPRDNPDNSHPSATLPLPVPCNTCILPPAPTNT